MRSLSCQCNWLHSLACALLCLAVLSVRGTDLDLTAAQVVASPHLPAREKKAVQMLVEEVEKRTQIRWKTSGAWPSSHGPVIALGLRSALRDFPGPYRRDLRMSDLAPAEGYTFCVNTVGSAPAVFVVGNDTRGLLFGVGRLLRELRMGRGRVVLDQKLQMTTSPRYPLRGHQLGYRPKCNSYDAWDLPVWEQYFRDLAVFGCNAVELIPPRSDDDASSPHFPRPPMEMMVGMSQLAADYGLDVWIWYPAMDKDYADPATVDLALREWGQVFSKLPRIDAVFVPGGDPGHTQPKTLMALLEKQTKNLHRYHPKAQMWVSPQSFNQQWLDEFMGILKTERPAWLSGVVFGPQVRVSLPRLRQLVPAQYPIRHYPDITHSRQCQYPVPDWDVAYAVTEARECINPRPRDEAAIFRKTQPFTIGFLTYSEGCNDDVNKIVWSALGWDPDTSVTQILKEYSRYFIGETYTDTFAEGLLALERNWRGSLLTNDSVESTLKQFQSLERGDPTTLRNWRFQQALLRAYYDASVRRRLVAESDLENRALQELSADSGHDALARIQAAEAILDQQVRDPAADRLRTRVMELGAALFQSIGMQLSVEKYRAIAVDRGACLDTLDYPLNDRRWLKEQFAGIRLLPAEPERLKGIQAIVHWTDPGPGGFYDDLGAPGRQPHLLRGASFVDDPGAMESARADFEEDLVVDEPDERSGRARRISWMDHAETLYDTPLQMRYTGLDPRAHYRLKVVYGGDSPKRKVRLVIGSGLEIHPYISKPFPIAPLEFPLPAADIQTGELLLKWSGEPSLGGNGRNCQVSEVWLLKEP